MGWIDRNGRSYYYKSRRVAGKVETEAFSGLRASLEASADERARAERGVKTALLEEDAALEAELDTLYSQIEEFTAERLHAAGYHRHKREWRRRRGGMG